MDGLQWTSAETIDRSFTLESVTKELALVMTAWVYVSAYMCMYFLTCTCMCIKTAYVYVRRVMFNGLLSWDGVKFYARDK